MSRRRNTSDGKIQKSFYEVWRAFLGAVQAAYKLAPCLIIVLALLMAGITWLALWSAKLMLGVVLLLVLGVAILVYATTDKYGEAALALVGGLLTAYSVPWSPQRFIAFVAVWSAFSFIALIIASIKIATRSESIYREASLAAADRTADHAEVEARLRSIGERSDAEGLGPIERAETLRLFVFRKLPLEVMPTALKAVSMLSVITQIEVKIVARFIADVYRIFEPGTPEHGQLILDIVYATIRTSAAPPADFLAGFEDSRRLVLSRSLDPTDYFAALQGALEAGVPPTGVADYLERSRER